MSYYGWQVEAMRDELLKFIRGIDDYQNFLAQICDAMEGVEATLLEEKEQRWRENTRPEGTAPDPADAMPF